MIDKSISVFFPAYNDGDNIKNIVNDVISILESLGNNYEIIIVNDGSTDNTQEVLDDLSKTIKSIKVIHHLKNKGYGGALKTGFSNCTKDLIFYTDSDGQYDAKELSRLLSSMTDGVDVVNGYKIWRSDPFYRIIIGKIYRWIVKKTFNLKLRDVACDFRLIRRAVFDKINLESNSGAVCVEMMKKIQDSGYGILEVPVHHYPRTFGKSQAFTFSHLLKMIWELIKLWFREFHKEGIK